MSAAILAEGLKSAWSSGGTTGADKTPSVSPGLDPGKYAFELWFNKQRRKEDEKKFQQEFNEKKREFDTVQAQDWAKTQIDAKNKDRQLGMVGIDMLAQSRSNALKNSRSSQFARDLYDVARG